MQNCGCIYAYLFLFFCVFKFFWFEILVLKQDLNIEKSKKEKDKLYRKSQEFTCDKMFNPPICLSVCSFYHYPFFWMKTISKDKSSWASATNSHSHPGLEADEPNPIQKSLKQGLEGNLYLHHMEELLCGRTETPMRDLSSVNSRILGGGSRMTVAVSKSLLCMVGGRMAGETEGRAPRALQLSVPGLSQCYSVDGVWVN